MRSVSKTSLKEVLTRELKLKNPEFRLESYGGRLNGSVISDTFKGKGDYRRQEMIWDALEKVIGPIATKRVGMLLAYTRDEWNPEGIAEKPAKN